MKKLTVTIGIAAHNEEKNIARLLSTLMKQNMSRFTLQEVLIYCDGCSDLTEQKAKEVANLYPIITVINDGNRIGKGQRLNQIFNRAKGEIIVTIDADIKMMDKNVFNNLIPYFSNKQVGLVGGKCVIVEANTFFQQIQETYVKFWRDITYHINNGNNVHTHLGPLSAIRSNIARKITIHLDVNAEDHFVYFSVKTLGYSYLFANNAVVGYKIPKYIPEYLKQYTRYLTSTDNIISYFEEIARSEYSVSKYLKLKFYIKHIFSSPIKMTAAIFMQVLERFYIKFININKNINTWDVVSSTK